MPELEHAIWLPLMIGCASAPAPAHVPAPVAPPAAGLAAAAAPAATVEVELEPICLDGYSGPQRGFLENARRPIAMVLLGHFAYSDVPECHLDSPLAPILTVAIPRATFYPHGTLAAAVLSGDPLRPLLDEECTHVLACDDLDGNAVCDLRGEPQLNGYNDRSRYLYASVSRPARLLLTMTSRDDRSCPGTSYYSPCCPEGYVHEQEGHTCTSMGPKADQVLARCPGP